MMDVQDGKVGLVETLELQGIDQEQVVQIHDVAIGLQDCRMLDDEVSIVGLGQMDLSIKITY